MSRKYQIRKDGAPEFERTLEKLNKRAKRAGLDGFMWHAGKPYWGEVEFEGRRWTEEFIDFEVTAVEAKFAGWRLMAVLAHDPEAGTIVQVVTEREFVTVPWQDAKPLCGHCGTNRRRKDTYVFRHEETGELKQVGRTCLELFTGMPMPNLYVLHRLIEDLEDEERERGGGGGSDAVPVKAVLAMAAKVVREDGRYWSKEQAALYDKLRTTSSVESLLYSKRSEDRRVSAQDEADGVAIREWVVSAYERESAMPDGASDWVTTLHKLAGPEYVSGRFVRLLASAVAGWLRAERDKQRAAEASVYPASVHIGSEKERITVGATVTGMREFDGNYGTTTTLVTFRMPTGQVLKWWSSREPEFEKGDTVTVTGTVKKHNEFRGTAETVITRAKVQVLQAV